MRIMKRAGMVALSCALWASGNTGGTVVGGADLAHTPADLAMASSPDLTGIAPVDMAMAPGADMATAGKIVAVDVALNGSLSFSPATVMISVSRFLTCASS